MKSFYQKQIAKSYSGQANSSDSNKSGLKHSYCWHSMDMLIGVIINVSKIIKSRVRYYCYANQSLLSLVCYSNFLWLRSKFLSSWSVLCVLEGISFCTLLSWISWIFLSLLSLI